MTPAPLFPRSAHRSYVLFGSPPNRRYSCVGSSRAVSCSRCWRRCLARCRCRPEAWPTRPVKFILTLGPGSGADIGARLLADRLTKKWDQPIVIENRPGGDGIVAINAFVSAQDDHVLLFAPSSSFIGHPYQHDNLPYKPSDLAPIARVSNTVVAISVPTGLPVKSLEEVRRVGARQARPAQLGRPDRRARHHVRGLAQERRRRHQEGAVPQSGRGRQRSRRPAASRSTSPPTPSPGRRFRPARSRCSP